MGNGQRTIAPVGGDLMRGPSWVPVLAGAIGVSIVVGCSRPPAVAPKAVFDLEEATIASLQQRMESGQDTARSLAEKYLARIDAIDRSGPTLKSVIELNPDALTIAGSLALEGSIAPADAFLVAKLRAAGAVVLGKTNLSEWANFRSTHSSSGWS